MSSNSDNSENFDSSDSDTNDGSVWFPVCVEDNHIFGIKTTNIRDQNQECSICYYDSADDEDHNTDIDNKINQDTIHHTRRYAQMFKKHIENTTITSAICPHQFHTVCLYQWFEQAKKMTCPVCKRGTQNTITVPPLLKKPPRFVTTYYTTGQKKICYFEINGQKHGPWTKYNQQGQLMTKMTYSHDQLHGYEYEYYPYTGKVRSKTKWEKGKKNGLHWVRTSMGFWITKCTYQNDMFHGEFREWFEGTDILRKACSYDDGRLHGVLREWDREQNLLLYSTYCHGIQWGRHIESYPNGVPHLKCFFNKEGELHGIRIQYFKSKEIKSIEYFDNGNPVQYTRKYYSNGLAALEGEYYEPNRKDNTWTEWYRNGNLKMQCYYENGALYGNYIRCTEQGDLIESAQYDGDTLHGKHIVMYPNRIPKLVEYYKDGLLDGSKVEYDKNGQPATKTEYRDGVMEGNFYDLATGVKCQYVDGVLNGKWLQMLQGKLLMEANFVDGQLHGQCKKLTESGTYIVIEYSHGQPLES